MTDSQSIRLSTFVEDEDARSYTHDDEDASSWSSDEEDRILNRTRGASPMPRSLAKTEGSSRRYQPFRSPVRLPPSLPYLGREKPLLYAFHSLRAYFRYEAKVISERIRAALAFRQVNAFYYDIENLYDDVVQGSPPFDPQEIMGYIARGREGDVCTLGEDDHRNDFHYDRDKKVKAWIGWPNMNIRGRANKLCSYLNNIADSVRRVKNRPEGGDDLVFSVFEDHSLQRGQTTVLVVIPRSRKDATWADIRCVVSMQIGKPRRNKECCRLMEYARRCFANQPNRRYVLGLSFLHKDLSFYVFDRSGTLATPYYNVDQNPEQFLQLAIGVLFMDYAQLGHDTSIYSKRDKNYINAGGKKYKMLCTLYNDDGLRGRGTMCFKAADKSGKVVVIKDSWVDRTRPTKEVDMLKLLRGSGIENIPLYTQLKLY